VTNNEAVKQVTVENPLFVCEFAHILSHRACNISRIILALTFLLEVLFAIALSLE